jgi:hypothetical protein
VSDSPNALRNRRRARYNAKYGTKHWVVWLISSTKPADHELPLPRVCGDYIGAQLIKVDAFKTFTEADEYARRLKADWGKWCRYAVRRIHERAPDPAQPMMGVV